MGIKERRTKILLALFLLSDLQNLNSIQAGVNFSLVKVDDRLQKTFDFTLNQKTRGTISGSIKEGSIQKTDEQLPPVKDQIQIESLNAALQTQSTPITNASPLNKDEVVSQPVSGYQLTEKGFYELCLEFPFLRFLKDRWDGRWRIISYEIPEKKREIRDRLRREMQGWGLGPWHRSFWLTPHPILETLRQLVSQKEEDKFIQAFEAQHQFGDRQILIEKVWQTSLIDKKYREMFKNWHDILAKDGDKIGKLKKVIEYYIGLLRQDPGLPVDLVGEKWIAFEAFNIFKEIKGILLS